MNTKSISKTITMIPDARTPYITPSPSFGANVAHLNPKSLDPNDIEVAALAARQSLVTTEMDATRRRCNIVNGVICADNFTHILGSDMMEVTIPINASRRARSRKHQIKRGFRFTIEGLDGVYKLHPLRRVG